MSSSCPHTDNDSAQCSSWRSSLTTHPKASSLNHHSHSSSSSLMDHYISIMTTNTTCCWNHQDSHHDFHHLEEKLEDFDSKTRISMKTTTIRKSSLISKTSLLRIFLSLSLLLLLVIRTSWFSFFGNHQSGAVHNTSPSSSWSSSTLLSTADSTTPLNYFFFVQAQGPLTIGRSSFPLENSERNPIHDSSSTTLYQSRFLSLMNVAASNDSRANPSSETYNPFYSISKQIASLKMNLVRMTFHGTIAPDTFDPESSD